MDGYSQVCQSLRILTMTFIFHKTYLHKVIATGKFSLCAKYDFYCCSLAGNDLFLGGITKPRGMFSLLYASFPYFSLQSCLSLCLYSIKGGLLFKAFFVSY